jgi:cell wall-associated NlpC family hydrolase
MTQEQEEAVILVEDIQRDQVVREALTWIGTPFHHAARVKGAGVDCGQFPLAVFEACGLIAHYEPEPYAQDFHIHNDEEIYLANIELFARKVETPLPGDIALFRIGRVVSHGAIVVSWPAIVHSWVDARAVVMDDAEGNSRLAKKFVGVWSFWKHPARTLYRDIDTSLP